MQNKILSIIFILIFISCAPARMIKEKEESIIASDHGYLILDFNYDKNVDPWTCKFIVNGELYFEGSFGGFYFIPKYTQEQNKKYYEYKFPVPAGDISIEYSLSTKEDEKTLYGTANKFSLSKFKKIQLNIKKNETVKLKLYDSKPIIVTTTCIIEYPLPYPWPGTYQEVILIVDKSK